MRCRYVGSRRTVGPFLSERGDLRWPEDATAESLKAVNRMRPLEVAVGCDEGTCEGVSVGVQGGIRSGFGGEGAVLMIFNVAGLGFSFGCDWVTWCCVVCMCTRGCTGGVI